MTVNDYFPWWSKILIKIVLSRIPVSYKSWRKLNIFKHGAMDDPVYAYKTFIKHYKTGNMMDKNNGYVMLELGPGDSLASGIIAKCLGACKSYLVDKSNDALVSSCNYKNILNHLNSVENIPENEKPNIEDIDEIKKYYNIEYMTEGLKSLRSLPDSSIDYLWSQSVLEHIKLDEFRDYVREFRRIIKEDGVSVHGVDLKDHLSYALNNLRFTEAMWESRFMSSSGFYTNRLRYSEILDIFSQEGFSPNILNLKKWKDLPTKKERMDEKFRNMRNEELLISEFDLLLHPS